MVSDRKKNTQKSDQQDIQMELEALKEDQIRFLDFAESASDWFWESGPDHRFTDLFGPALERSGFAAEDYIGELRTVGVDVNREPERWQSHFDDLENHRPFRDFLVQRTSLEGKERWAKISGRPFFANDGAFKGYRGTGTDITEQIQAQQLSNRLNDLLVDAVNSIPEGFILFDENDRVVICNQNYRQSHDFLGELLEPGTTFYDFALAIAKSGRVSESQSDPEEWLKNRIEQHQNPGDPFIVDYEDGTSTLISEFKTRQGGTAIVRSDVTYQKKIERDLLLNEERFRDFAEATSDWFWETDQNHQFSFISAQYGERIGVPVERLIGKSIEKAPPKDIDDKIWTSLTSRMIAQEEFRDIIQPRILPDGEVVWLSISGKPVFNNSGQFKGHRGTAMDITHRIKIEEELRENEQRFKDFSNVASDWFWETDEENRFSYFSDQFELITEINPATLLGKKREESRPLGINDESWQALLDDMAAHRSFRKVVFSRQRPSGEDVWMRVNGIPHFDKAGHFKGYRCTGTDITQEIKASNEIQRTQQLLYNAVEVMEDGFVLFDADDRLILCNQKYRDMYHEVADVLKPGITFPEIIQAAADRLQVLDILKDKDGWLKNRMEQHLNPRGHFDEQLTRGDWVRVIEQKTVEGGVVGLRINITQEKQEEQELRKLSHALEQSPSMIFITDAEGCIEYVNQMFTTISGYTAEEVIGKNPRILKSGETPPEIYSDLWQALQSGREWKGELKDRRKDGSIFWANATISSVRNKDGEITHFVSMHEDITQRKEIELREFKAKEQAEMANRAKSELLANMSHELRTPLNAIIGFSQTFQAQLFGPLGHEKYLEYATDIANSGEHLLKLINDILDVSAIEAGGLKLREENVSLPDVIDATMRLIEPHAQADRVSVISSINPKLPLIKGDVRRIKQVFLNLLSNAVKFTPEGGEISINALFNDDGSLAVVVTDTGIGMDEEGLAIALSSFGQVDSGLDRKHEGTGLGLPLTLKLMELHDGTLKIKSAVGHGTTATVIFPVERVV
jgi:PAS domain S-box-containing protein